MTQYAAGKELRVGGPPEIRHFVDRPADPDYDMPELSHDEEHGTVLTYQEGDVVPGAEHFDNLDDLVRDGFLVEVKSGAKKSTAKKADDNAAEPKPKSTAKRSGSRSRSASG